ncbi:MAG: nucleotidyltransferase substrate binding protein [Colwellia sp.]|nr:nucleotidyltransferase substrate binding protein [Colwellia sp.]
MDLNPLRWKQRLENLNKAGKRLNDACQQQSYNDLERAGLVQTFEFSFELTWKTLKDLVEYEGYEVASPRSVIRTALQANHITPEQCETLLEALNKRNLLTHTYNEDNALEAQRLIINDFSPVINAIVNKLNHKLNNDD